MAGALHVSLGGDNTYAGELIPAQRFGAEFQPPSPNEATQAIRLVSVASLIGLGIGIVVTCLVRARKRD